MSGSIYNQPHQRWWYKVTMDATNNGITIQEDGGTPVSLTLDAGDYYHGTQLDGLLNALLAKINASALTGTYSFEITTPSTSVDMGAVGLRMRVSGLSTSLAVTVFNGAAPTRPSLEDCLGFGAGGTINGVADGSDFVLDAPFCLAGVWVPLRPYIRYTRGSGRLAASSTPYLEDADTYVMDRGLRATRTVRYTHLPSTRIHTDRATLQGYAKTAQEGWGDTGNNFTWLWERLSKGDAITVSHHDAVDPQTIGIPTTDIEELVAFDLAAVDSLDKVATLQRAGGEFHAVEFKCAVVNSNLAY